MKDISSPLEYAFLDLRFDDDNQFYVKAAWPEGASKKVIRELLKVSAENLIDEFLEERDER